MSCDKIMEGIIIGVFGGLFSGIGIWVLDRVRETWNFNKHEKKIVNFITKTINDTDNSFNTTIRISSEVNLTESRVNEVCSNSDKIRRSQKEKEVWTLRDN